MVMRRKSLLALASLALPLLAGCTTNPVTGKSQLDLMGEAGEIRMGISYYPGAVQSSLGPIDGKDVQATVERVGLAVAGVGHRPGLPYQFTAVNDPEVNAFALPGGKICVTRGMLSRLESEDGLAAVLGHEVGHVTARHAVAAYNRQILTTAVLVGGEVYMESQDVKNRGLITLGAMIGAQVILAKYSRDQERQSDELGLDYSVKAGYSPRGMIETQRILVDLQKSKPGAVEKLFASHPMSAERLDTAEKRVAKLPADVQARPLRSEPYRVAMADVIAERPAWDLAAEGQALLGQKKYEEAQQKLAQAVRLAPKAGVIRTLHAVSLGSLKQKGPAADEARQGARLAGNVYVSQLVAGELLVEPDPTGALGNLDTAEKLLPGEAVVPLLRGEALEKLGRKSDAAAAYKEAYDRDPNGEVGAEAARRLQKLG
jgi:predicted Zn-dependent protease